MVSEYPASGFVYRIQNMRMSIKPMNSGRQCLMVIILYLTNPHLTLVERRACKWRDNRHNVREQIADDDRQ